MREIIRTLVSFADKRSKVSILSFCIFLTAVIGYIDYITGFEISLSLFYLIPIMIASWFIGSFLSVFLAVISITIWTVSDIAAGINFTLLPNFAQSSSAILLASCLQCR